MNAVQSNHMPVLPTQSAALAFAAQTFDRTLDELLSEFKVFFGHNELTGAVELQVWEPTWGASGVTYSGGAVCSVA